MENRAYHAMVLTGCWKSVELLALVQIRGLDSFALNWTGHVGIGTSFREIGHCLHLFLNYNDSL